MLSTIVAFGLYFTNPKGLDEVGKQHPVAYVFADESAPREYSSKKECEADKRVAVKELRSKLEDMYMTAETEKEQQQYEAAKNRNESLKCISFEREVSAPVPEPDSVADDGLVDVWRIGRFDDQDVFHGTDYNSAVFQNEADCTKGLKKTWGKVMDTAMKQGGSGEDAMDALDKFRQTYACHKIVVQADQVKPTQRRTTAVEEAPSRVRAQAIPRPDMQAAPVANVDEGQDVPAQAPSPMPNSSYMEPQSMTNYRPAPVNRFSNFMPSKPYYMAEHVRREDGVWQWVHYQSAFATPAQCWGAVKEFLRGEEQGMLKSYQNMQPSYAAAEWYRTGMTNLNYRRTQISCVTIN